MSLPFFFLFVKSISTTSNRIFALKYYIMMFVSTYALIFWFFGMQILRTSRFFPEADDLDDSEGVEVISDENLKANEYLNRRLSIEDCVLAHELAMEKAKDVCTTRCIS